MTKNKKGIFFLTPIILLIITIFLIFLISYIFKQFTFWVIGIGTIIFGIYLLFIIGSKKVKTILAIVLVGVGMIMIIIVFSGVQPTILSGAQYIQIPTHGYYECNAASQPVTSFQKSIENGKVIGVKCPDNTDKCDIIALSTESLGVLAFQRHIEFKQGINIVAHSDFTDNAKSQVKYSISKGQSIDIYYSKSELIGRTYFNGGTYYATYNPFILWNNPGLGGRYEYTNPTQGCMFQTNKNLIIEDTLGIGTGSSTSTSTLEPYKTRNYIDVAIPISVENRRIQGGLYCQNNNLYPIENIRVVSGEYNVVNYDKITKSVQCCNGDFEPGFTCVDNTWKELPKTIQEAGVQKISCSLFNQCPNTEWVPSGDKAQSRYVCENSICIPKTRNVGCNYYSDCSTGTTCDRISSTCVKVPLPIGTGIVQTSLITEEQCLAQAKEAGNFALTIPTYTKTTTNPNFLDKTITIFTFGAVGDLSTSTKESCDLKINPIYIIGGVFLIILIFGVVIIYLIFSKPKKTK